MFDGLIQSLKKGLDEPIRWPKMDTLQGRLFSPFPDVHFFRDWNPQQVTRLNAAVSSQHPSQFEGWIILDLKTTLSVSDLVI